MSKKTKPEPMRMVLVEWLDAASADSGWKTLKSIRKAGPALVRTIGWLVADEPGYITVVSSHIPGWDHVDGDVVIVRGMVQSITHLAADPAIVTPPK